VAKPSQPEDSMSANLYNSKRNLAKRLKRRFHGYNKKLEKGSKRGRNLRSKRSFRMVRPAVKIRFLLHYILNRHLFVKQEF
jgi:hypothetical protein